MIKVRSLIVSEIMAGALGLVLSIGCAADMRDNEIAEKKLVEVRISMQKTVEDKYVELLLSDEAEVHRIVENPLRDAKLDRNPARYIFLADMFLKYSDGSRESVALFLRWGHCKFRGKYLISDFGPLRDTMVDSLEYATKETRRVVPE